MNWSTAGIPGGGNVVAGGGWVLIEVLPVLFWMSDAVSAISEKTPNLASSRCKRLTLRGLGDEFSLFMAMGEVPRAAFKPFKALGRLFVFKFVSTYSNLDP